jgi:hypothetical protein
METGKLPLEIVRKSHYCRHCFEDGKGLATRFAPQIQIRGQRSLRNPENESL